MGRISVICETRGHERSSWGCLGRVLSDLVDEAHAPRLSSVRSVVYGDGVAFLKALGNGLLIVAAPTGVLGHGFLDDHNAELGRPTKD